MNVQYICIYYCVCIPLLFANCKLQFANNKGIITDITRVYTIHEYLHEFLV